MSGICGFTGQPNKEILQIMGDAVVHRGSDDRSYLCSNNINLYSGILAASSRKKVRQPVHNEDCSVCAVYDGEIYNLPELKNSLSEFNHQFCMGASNEEVIVHLYEEYGLDFVQKINGMFAIALYDYKKERVILIRDRMGIKPLFYSLIDNELIFASEIKAILAHHKMIKKINFNALYHYFSFKNITGNNTAFENIFQLLPGEIIIYQNHQLTKNQYWSIDFSMNSGDSFDIAKEKITILLDDATKIRLSSDTEIGAFLSGGIDSSLVVAFGSKYVKNIKSYSLGYEKTSSIFHKETDIINARIVSKMYGTEHNEYIMNPYDVIEYMDQVVRSFDQPFSGVTTTFFLAKVVSEYMKTVVTGDGADELFGSYIAPRLAFPMDYFSNFAACDNLTNTQKEMLKPFENNIAFLKELYEYSKGDMALWKYKLLLNSDEEKSKFLTKSFMDSISFETNTLTLIRNLVSNLTATDPLNKILELEWKTLLSDQVLPFMGTLSMANSLEIRSPFLDYRIVEYVASLPGSYKIVGGDIKYLLKKIAEPFLPKEVIYRKKEGFILPISDWMQDEFKEYITDTLSESRVRKYDFLDYVYVNSLLDNFYHKKQTDKYGVLWNVLMFQKWCELYV